MSPPYAIYENNMLQSVRDYLTMQEFQDLHFEGKKVKTISPREAERLREVLLEKKIS